MGSALYVLFVEKRSGLAKRWMKFRFRIPFDYTHMFGEQSSNVSNQGRRNLPTCQLFQFLHNPLTVVG
jgi:hypothetical protein